MNLARGRLGSLRFRLTLLTVVVVALILGVFSAGILITTNRFLVERVDDQLILLGDTVGNRLLAQVIDRRAGAPNPQARDPNAPVTVAGTPAGTEALLFDATGDMMVGWDLVAGVPLEETAATQRQISRARGELSSQRGDATLFTMGGRRLLVVSPNTRWPADISLLVSMPLDEANQTISTLQGALMVGSAAAMLSAALLGSLFVRLGLRPLNRVTAVARRISSGERGLRVGEHNPYTEVGALAQSFDTMLGELESAVASAQASEAKIKRFVADAAHELRTPLASVRGHAELLRRGMADPAQIDEVAGRIEDGGVRLGSLVDQMLTLARLDASAPLDREIFALDNVVAQAVADASVRHPDHEFSMVAEGPTAFVDGDALRIRQMVDNLLANAGRHTPAGTAVSVTVEPVPVEPAPGAVAADRTPPMVRLLVSDDGPGVEVDPSIDLFERFVRADTSRTRDTGGSGLGLSIVRGVAEAHGGSAELLASSTDRPRGTTVMVLLPAAAPPTA